MAAINQFSEYENINMKGKFNAKINSGKNVAYVTSLKMRRNSYDISCQIKRRLIQY